MRRIRHIRHTACALFVLATCALTPVRACPSVPWQPISAAVWAWMPDERDPQSPPQPIAAVIDERQAVLIDPGPSAAHGARAQQSLACRFQASLRWVVLTHGDPESVRGLQGLQLPDAGVVRAPASGSCSP